MKRFVKFAAICAFILGSGYATCAFIAPTYYIRYRLTMDVDVQGVMHRGMGVVEIAYQLLPERFTAGFGGAHFRGEMRGYAITVDLGDRGLLYLVDSTPQLRPGDDGPPLYPHAGSMASLPLVAYGLPGYETSSFMEPILQDLQRKTGHVDVALDKLPMLLRFRPNGDPRRAYEVDPKDLSKSYGVGVRITRATVELTDQRVTPMPEIWPAWLKAIQGQMPRYRPDNDNLIIFDNNLDSTAFKGE